MSRQPKQTFQEYLLEHFVPYREPEEFVNGNYGVGINTTTDLFRFASGSIQMVFLSLTYFVGNVVTKIREKRQKKIPHEPKKDMPDPESTKPPVVVPIMPV